MIKFRENLNQLLTRFKKSIGREPMREEIKINTSMGTYRLPPQYYELLYNIKWEFNDRFILKLPENNAVNEISDILFVKSESTVDEYPQFRRPYIIICHGDGGNELLLLDIDDANPDDPVLYYHSHDDYQYQPMAIKKNVKEKFHLSDFFNSLGIDEERSRFLKKQQEEAFNKNKEEILKKFEEFHQHEYDYFHCTEDEMDIDFTVIAVDVKLKIFTEDIEKACMLLLKALELDESLIQETTPKILFLEKMYELSNAHLYGELFFPDLMGNLILKKYFKTKIDLLWGFMQIAEYIEAGSYIVFSGKTKYYKMKFENGKHSFNKSM